jgi:hypothetical protein
MFILIVTIFGLPLTLILETAPIDLVVTVEVDYIGIWGNTMIETIQVFLLRTTRGLMLFLQVD